ncbi:DNA polymerase [Arthrobacter flavus]|uniref:DNA polymerase n=1 Tax=Arthrobacter flavus TaxID=95172 RepID=A0ABW4Q9V1_9MICC
MSRYTARALQDEADLANFQRWLVGHPGRLGLAMISDPKDQLFQKGFRCHLLAVGAQDGSGWVVATEDRDLARRFGVALFHGEKRRVWAHDANATAWAIRRTLDLKLDSLRCTLLGARVAWPGAKPDPENALNAHLAPALTSLRATWGERTGKQVHGEEWPARAAAELPLADPALLSYAAGKAVECAQLADELAAIEWARPHILREVAVDQMWRWTGYDGIRVDTQELMSLIASIEGALDGASSALGFIPATSGPEVHSFIRRLGAELPKTATGAASLAQNTRHLAEVPEKSSKDWQYFCDVLEIRSSLTKLTEIRRCLDIDGRVHPTINTTKAITGRSSVTEPAMQNLRSAKDPKRQPAAYALNPGLIRSQRYILMADPGKVLIGCDLSHVEPSLLAVVTQDPELIKAVDRENDIYVEIAAKVWGLPAREVDQNGKRTETAEKHRSAAKTILLSLMYGKGDKMLAYDLRMSLAEAGKLKQQILSAYPIMNRWISAQRKLVQLGGTPSTLAGRRLFGDMTKPYTAVNYIIQGSAADIFKDFCLAVGARVPAGTRLFLPVHDEIVLECFPEQVDDVSVILKEEMHLELDGVEIWGEPTVLGEHWGKA